MISFVFRLLDRIAGRKEKEEEPPATPTKREMRPSELMAAGDMQYNVVVNILRFLTYNFDAELLRKMCEFTRWDSPHINVKTVGMNEDNPAAVGDCYYRMSLGFHRVETPTLKLGTGRLPAKMELQITFDEVNRMDGLTSSVTFICHSFWEEAPEHGLTCDLDYDIAHDQNIADGFAIRLFPALKVMVEQTVDDIDALYKEFVKAIHVQLADKDKREDNGAKVIVLHQSHQQHKGRQDQS